MLEFGKSLLSESDSGGAPVEHFIYSGSVIIPGLGKIEPLLALFSLKANVVSGARLGAEEFRPTPGPPPKPMSRLKGRYQGIIYPRWRFECSEGRFVER